MVNSEGEFISEIRVNSEHINVVLHIFKYLGVISYDR